MSDVSATQLKAIKRGHNQPKARQTHKTARQTNATDHESPTRASHLRFKWLRHLVFNIAAREVWQWIKDHWFS